MDTSGRRTCAKAELIFPEDKRLTEKDFEALRDLLAILDPFRKFTTALQADKGTAGMMVPAVFKLFRVINSPFVARTVPASGPGRDRAAVTQQVAVTRLDDGVQQIRIACTATCWSASTGPTSGTSPSPPSLTRTTR